MAEIIELNRIEMLLAHAQEDIAGNKVIKNPVPGMHEAILKFESTSVCELLGYQIARAFGVRVPRMRGFWTRVAVDFKRTHATPGRIGILVEYYEDWEPVGREKAAILDPIQTARSIALCVLDRHEWGEFGRSGGKLFFVDLEYILPVIKPEELVAVSEPERRELLRERQGEYSRGDHAAIGEVLREAKQLNLRDLVVQELRRFCRIRPTEYCQFFEVAGHPLGALISRFASSAFGNRLNTLSKWFDMPIYRVPTWEDTMR